MAFESGTQEHDKSKRGLMASFGNLAEALYAVRRFCPTLAVLAIHGSHPPAAAALAADIAIQGQLSAGTAALESALAGVRTLLLDREGWHVSPLYRLGVGRVVFTNWDDLWNALTDHWASPGGVPGLGDWSPMLNELDPFRDGRAAERMGTYLHWLIEGLRDGRDREIVMADAAERYCREWGWDKIQEVNSTSKRRPVSPLDTVFERPVL